ncbi:unnamed protein product [Adineta steineri]|uniref:MULE transposase domain-containing protein n=1 Tax=Adineta steineri TaxID=433720 RepID=A0A815BUK7_9BILA|nr:unnamed protein product [Adineta steineri]CAF4121702.1 unnamed protein product [Adineta steineri]
MHTDQNDQYLGKSGDHYSHLPMPETIELSIFKEKVKKRVVKETGAIGKIYDNELAAAAFTDAALALAPLPIDAKSSLNRLRRQTTPTLPKSSIFDVPDAYSITTNGASFVFSDTLVRKKRIILFATDEQLRTLFSATHIMMDDYPCVIGLLPGRTVPIYKHVFNLLDAAARRLNLKFEPKHIMSDFEKALINTIATQTLNGFTFIAGERRGTSF